MAEEDYEDGDFDMVEATFGSYDPNPEDASGIAQFIPKYLNCDRVELSIIIAGQTRVGTVIKTEEENPEDVSLFGFITVLNLDYYQHHACIQNFISWLQSLDDQILNELLATELNRIGLFLNERAYGIPPDYAPHLNRGLFKEVMWATEDLPEDQRDYFNFTHYILVKKGVKSDDGIEFQLIEDDFYFRNADHVIEFQTEGEEGDLEELEYHRYVLILTPDSIHTSRMQLNEMLGVDESQFEDEG